MNAEERSGPEPQRRLDRTSGGGTLSRDLAEALTRRLSPLATHQTLDAALRDWARTLRARGVAAERMITTLRELWFECGGPSQFALADRPEPLTLASINETALRAYWRDD
jgi:hypothetical protein